MSDWSAQQYLKFEDERTRPARDLLGAVLSQSPKKVIDLGCGPGNSTELLAARWPQAKVIGVDSSPDMLAQAKKRLPNLSFEHGDITQWSPPPDTDVLYSNAVFQWVPDNLAQMVRLFKGLPKGATLAIQLPDTFNEPVQVLMRETARMPQFQHLMGEVARLRDDLPKVNDYYDAFCSAGTRAQIWLTTYNHSLENVEAIVEWMKGSGLRPFLDVLDDKDRADFLHTYTGYVAAAHLPRADGRVILPFPRLFIVAVR